MARRRVKDNQEKELKTLIAMIFIGVFFFIKFMIKAIRCIIKAIIRIFAKIDELGKKKEITNSHKDTVHKENATCACSNFENRQDHYKHIYELILKIKKLKNTPFIIDEIKNYISEIKRDLNNTKAYIEKNAQFFEDKIRISHFAYAHHVGLQIDNYSKQIIKYKDNEDKLVDILKQLMNLSEQVSHKVRVTMNTKNPSLIPSIKQTSKSSKQNTVGEMVMGAVLLESLHFSREKGTIDEKLETEMDAYNLEEWQKELIRQGDYNFWNFEEGEDLEEEDYYYEDN